MFKKLGAVVTATAAGTVMLAGAASAAEVPGPLEVGGIDVVDNSDHVQVGLVNTNDTDLLHNADVVVGACDLDVNALIAQVPVEDVANGLDVPVGSPGVNEAEALAGDVCATGGILDAGHGQSS
ncbi:hypothetical protein [Umezawaea beigongshangensis]|uniref:hypothetical protein n=1 Tax=Umezawaea beigongshangensis TaxID=2780383 RepID=UPI0018F1DAF6|nr:hypothetical protein [Umezawaea beigongshangensis]